ncbi:MAG: single-stranded DNA-binding protein [Candidatus Peribacteraceae bacterium]|nr:single-stranded DNA-binding protein [Candidatus Peribacteraceae bacterium]
MFSLNRVQLIGYQTQPVQVRQTPSGSSVVDLNIVTPYSFKADSGEMLDGKGFHVVTLWGPMADVAGKYVRPGAQLFISGRLQTDSWQDEKTNEKRSKTKMVALDIILLDPKEGQRAAPDGASAITQCLNRADIIGNVTRDPEIRTTTSGQKVLTLGVATNEKWKDRNSGEEKERVEFHNVVLWGALAEQAGKAAKKGYRVFVSGRVQTRSWETKEGGKRTTTEIIADTISLLGVSNTAVQNNISNEVRSFNAESGGGSPRSESSPARSSSPDMNIEVPAVTYASEIKAEDLPF